MTREPTPDPQVDLNADVGEAGDTEARRVEFALMQVVTSVNIACGGHAGDDETMHEAARSAIVCGCAIGAHPSYPDRPGFGRRRILMSPGELKASLAEQIGALARVCGRLNTRLVHVKPHGALYHDSSHDEQVARAVYESASLACPGAALVGAAGSRALAWWGGWGATTLAEGFADRRYEADGGLRSRTLIGALLTHPHEAAAQAVRLVTRDEVETYGGSVVRLVIQTLCLHADTPGAVNIAAAVRHSLEASGVRLRPQRLEKP